MNERKILKFKSKILVRMLWLYHTQEANKHNYNLYDTQRSFKSMVNKDLKDIKKVKEVTRNCTFKFLPLCLN